MNSMVLGFAGYSLLLSGFVALILLLRMGCVKDILKSPLHILSTSDTIISMITSVILLVSQSLSSSNFDQASLPDRIAGGRLLKDRENGEYQQNQTCVRFYFNYSDSLPDTQDLGGTRMNCTFHHVLMQYAMFLVPFANAFMSLLIYSIQCSSGISCVAKRCSKLTKVAENMIQELDSNFPKRDSCAKKDANPNFKDSRADENTQKTILTILNGETNPRNPNNKYTGFGLIMQWLAPVLVTAVLYLSNPQDMGKLRESNEMDCIFRVNFPLESCSEANMVDVGSLMNRNENYYGGLTDNVVVDDSDALRISYPDSETIDEIISKVQSVVRSAISKTCNNSTELKNSSSFRPWNITRYITSNDLMQRNLTSDEHEMLEKLSKMQQALDNKDPETWGKECTTTKIDDSVKADQEINEAEEWKLFEDAVEMAENKQITESPTATRGTMQQDITASAMTKENEDILEDETDEVQEENQSERDLHGESLKNKTAATTAENVKKEKLNDKIYKDIVKRIRDTVSKVKVKEQTGNLGADSGVSNNNSRIMKPEIYSLGSGSASSKVGDDRKGRENIVSQSEGERVSEAQLHMYDGCFLSAKFLKIHLFVLLFIGYFIPVLISVVLQTRALYTCKNVCQQIETADKETIDTSKILDINSSKTDENPASKSGWFPNGFDDAINMDLRVLENSQDIEHEEFKLQELEDKKTGFKNVLQETKGIQMLFNILTKSLMLGILMWTPAFLEILSKVFLCTSPPSWLVNVLYSLGVSFGIVKNFLNVNIAKINKHMRDEFQRKANSVHPSV